MQNRNWFCKHSLVVLKVFLSYKINLFQVLACQHPCVGFCGEPCPKLCRVCDEKKIKKLFPKLKDDGNAR